MPTTWSSLLAEPGFRSILNYGLPKAAGAPQGARASVAVPPCVWVGAAVQSGFRVHGDARAAVRWAPVSRLGVGWGDPPPPAAALHSGRGAAARARGSRRSLGPGGVPGTCSQGAGTSPFRRCAASGLSGGVRRAKEIPEATGWRRARWAGRRRPQSIPRRGWRRLPSGITQSQGRGHRDRGRRVREGHPDAQVREAPSPDGAGTVRPGGCGLHRDKPRPL